MEQLLPLIIIGVIALIALGVLWYIVTRFLVNIGATEVGIKERRYLGRRMPQGRVVANAGEVGIQAEVLKPGLHFVPYPIERVSQKVPLIEIGADELGIIEAIDGEPRKLVVLKGYGHYEVYLEPAFSEVMRETLAWYQRYLPARPV